MRKIDLSKIENPVAKHILKSFHAREDFELSQYNYASCTYSNKQNKIKLFNPMWDKEYVDVIFYMDIRGSEYPEIKVPIRILYKDEGWDEWDNAYCGWIDSIDSFDSIMIGIGLIGSDED